MTGLQTFNTEISLFSFSSFLGRPKERPYVVTFVRLSVRLSVCLSVRPSTIWYPLFLLMSTGHTSSRNNLIFGMEVYYGIVKKPVSFFDVGGVIVAMVTLVFMELPTFWYPLFECLSTILYPLFY